MERNTTELLRRAQLMIALEIKRICEKNDIKYFLDAGSLLGAVRHNGFIPWDDDMDIGMCKDDYERFVEVAPREMGQDYFLDNYVTNKKNPYVFSKVRLRGTTYIENIGNENYEHNEIFVDIFPYYYISDNELERKIEGIRMAILSQAILSKSGYKVWKGKGLIKRIKFMPIDVIGKLFTMQFLRKKIAVLYTKHNNTQRMGIQAGSCYGYWYFEENILRETENHKFENEVFPIPKNYDIYLKVAYGDYMKLPPESERITHMIQCLDFGTVEIR